MPNPGTQGSYEPFPLDASVNLEMQGLSEADEENPGVYLIPGDPQRIPLWLDVRNDTDASATVYLEIVEGDGVVIWKEQDGAEQWPLPMTWNYGEQPQRVYVTFVGSSHAVIQLRMQLLYPPPVWGNTLTDLVKVNAAAFVPKEIFFRAAPTGHLYVTYDENDNYVGDKADTKSPDVPEWDADKGLKGGAAYERAGDGARKPLKILASFAGPAGETVSVRAKMGGKIVVKEKAVLLDDGGKSAKNEFDVKVFDGDTELDPIGDAVDYQTPKWDWEFKIGAGDWTATTRSEHRIYVTLATPLDNAYEARRDSIFFIGCSAGIGSKDIDQCFAKVWDYFKARKVINVRSDQLFFWKTLDPGDDKNSTTAQGLLVGKTHSGQCNAWVELFSRVLRIHRITTDTIAIRPAIDTDKPAKSPVPLPPSIIEALAAGAIKPNIVRANVGLLVIGTEFKAPLTTASPYKWTINLPPAIPAANWPAPKCVDPENRQAQGHDKAAGIFANHFLIQYPSGTDARKGGKIYDPSYGAGDFRDLKQYEAERIDGFFCVIGDFDGKPAFAP